MALNTKFKSSFEEFEIYLYKTLSNEDLNNLTNRKNLKNSIKITAFLEFLNFETRSQFINSNQDENIRYLKEFSKLPIVLIEASYEWLEIISENEFIISIHGNHQVYLCLESESNNIEIKEKRNSINEFSGKDVTIGLIDSGIDQSHPELSNKIVKIYNVSSESKGDFNGHGTFLAGVITGVAPEAGIIDIKVFNKEGKATVAEVLDALDLVLSDINDKFPDIIVFGCADWLFDKNNLITRYCELLNQHNIAIVTPTGNFGPDLGNICSLGGNPNVLTVGAINKENKVPFFSGRSEGIDLGLLGKDVTSAISSTHVIGTPLKHDTKHIILSGTSISAATAGGMLALLKESNPNLTPLQLYKLIKETSQGRGVPKINQITQKKILKKISTYSFSSIVKIASLISGSIFILFVILYYMIR
ncbi:MAG: S8 family serine peptidase [Promethearchaeota archaeon]